MTISDELENHWGTQFVILRGSRVASKSTNQLNQLIKHSMPDYELLSCQTAGTHANMVALQVATDYNIDTCLFGIGGYLGGEGSLQECSTSMYDETCCLSIPKYVENATDRCFHHTVPLPYHISGGIDDEDLLDLEEECLCCFHKKLIIRRLSSSAPFTTLLLEVVLGGNGTFLTDRFLVRLGKLCKQHSISVIVDEVLTAGRAADQMALTLTLPREFQDSPVYHHGQNLQFCFGLEEDAKKAYLQVRYLYWQLMFGICVTL